MRSLKLLPPLLAFVLIGLGGWRLSHFLASRHRAFQVREFAQAHPLLRWLGPDQSATQGGLTLLAIQKVNPYFGYEYDVNGPKRMSWSSASGKPLPENNLGLWISTNAQVPTAPSPSLTVTGHASTGEQFRLIQNTNGIYASPAMLFVLPGGYPDTVKWVDVTTADQQGHHATWRVSNLPPVPHLAASPVHSTYHRGGIHFAFRAWHEQGTVKYDLTGRITPFQHLWSVEIKDNEQWEWGGRTSAYPSSITSGFGPPGRCRVLGTLGGRQNGSQPIPFLRAQHTLRFFASLRQFDTYDETVTFQNVSVRKNKAGALCLAPARPLTATTPSGITITLPDVSAAQINGQPVSGAGIWYTLNANPSSLATTLPKSPLWRKYRRPVSVIVLPKLAAGYRYGGGEGDGKTSLSFLTGPSPKSRHFARFTVSVEQQVDLQKIPMTFTVPIGEHS